MTVARCFIGLIALCIECSTSSIAMNACVSILPKSIAGTASDCNICLVFSACPFMICQLLAGRQHTQHSMLTSEQHGQKQAAPGGPDISQLRPDLQAQWMHDKNNHFGSIVVTPYTDRKVWWSCPSCPDGHAHIWEATVAHRSQGTGCP